MRIRRRTGALAFAAALLATSTPSVSPVAANASQGCDQLLPRGIECLPPPQASVVRTENHDHDVVVNRFPVVCAQRTPRPASVPYVDFRRSSFGPSTADCFDAGLVLRFVAFDNTYRLDDGPLNHGPIATPATLGFVGENGWICKPQALHGEPPGTPGGGVETPLATQDYRQLVLDTIRAAVFVPKFETGDHCIFSDTSVPCSGCATAGRE